jgi:hypothetical protein
MTHDLPPDRQDKACALFGDLIAGRWEAVHQKFDVTMRERADVERIARGWTHLADHVGSFKRIGAATTRQSGDYAVTDVSLTFASVEAIARVVLDSDDRVAGLAVKHPHRRRLDPRPVRVFVLRNPEVAGLFRRF